MTRHLWLRTGCQWRNLPKDLPPWPTVYDYFRQWERMERIARIHAHLRDHIRLLEGRKRQPTAGILDSQSVKGSETCGLCGYDAGKKINGRKRHILVDTLGLLLLVKVPPANVQARDGERRLLAQAFKVYRLASVMAILEPSGVASIPLQKARTGK